MGALLAEEVSDDVRWERTDTTLRFVLVSDACPARIALFTGQDWEAT